jgi:hypothetical protein
VKTRVAMVDFLAKEPKNWERVYDKIKQYRKEHEAPVDTMGCATLADVNASEKVSLIKKKKNEIKTLLLTIRKGPTFSNISITHVVFTNKRYRHKCRCPQAKDKFTRWINVREHQQCR